LRRVGNGAWPPSPLGLTSSDKLLALADEVIE
jgi:hypothetical protein